MTIAATPDVITTTERPKLIRKCPTGILEQCMAFRELMRRVLSSFTFAMPPSNIGRRREKDS